MSFVRHGFATFTAVAYGGLKIQYSQLLLTKQAGDAID
jgi:hypothetical protein